MNDFCETSNASRAVKALQADLRMLLQPEAVPGLDLGGSAELQGLQSLTAPTPVLDKLKEANQGQ